MTPPTPQALQALQPFDMNSIPQLVAAVGALGLASMGIVDALGKVFVFDSLSKKMRLKVFGLPYAGYGPVKRLVQKVAPALEVSYGDRYAAVIINQYKAGRGAGQAPDTIRQGVRLGLPYLDEKAALRVVGAVWGMEPRLTKAFVASLRAGTIGATPPENPPDTDISIAAAQTLAARFATALDTRVQSVFTSAEQDYQSWMRFASGITALVLAVIYNLATTNGKMELKDWGMAVLVGLVAVPLAPIAKDLSASLSQALGALGQVFNKPKP